MTHAARLLTALVATAFLSVGTTAMADGGPCDSVPVIRTTSAGVDFVRTPDSCFDSLPGWPYAPEYVEIDGLRQAYVDEGPAEGPVVLLLHGQPSWSYLYRRMIPVLVDAGYRVIAMDHLGMGRSDKPIDIASYSYLGHNDRLERFIEALDLRDINLFVQDWGSLIGLRVAGLNSGRFARIAVGNGILPVIPEGIQPFPPVQNPDEIVDIPSPFASIPAQQVPFYDGCELLIPRDDNSYFGFWMTYAMKAESFRASEVVEALTWFDLPAEEEAAYDAPFPSRIYMAGPRVFPSLINDVPGTTDEAWSALTFFDRPFLTLWAANDAGAQGSCEAQQYLIDSVPGAAGQPHDRLEEAGHFLQDDQGEEIGRRLVDFYSPPSVTVDLTGGRVAMFLDRDGTAKDWAVVKFVRDTAIVAPLPDPTVDTSSLRMLSDTADTCTVYLDQSNWKRSGSGFVYRFPLRESPPGGIFNVIFKPGHSGGKLIIRAKGDGYGTNAVFGPVAFAQAEFSVGATTYSGRFQSPPAKEISNTAEKVLLKGKNASVPVNPGHELIDPSGFPNLVVWGTQDLSIAEYDGLTPPPGWIRNQPREGVGARGRFLRSPGRDADGDFTRQEMFGVSWLHQATIVSIDGSLDPEGLLNASTVEKHHELTWCAGSSITVLTSPEGVRYVLVSRDARRTFDTPTIPDGWVLEVIPLEENLQMLLPLHTTVIRADNQDSFQGPLPSDLDL